MIRSLIVLEDESHHLIGISGMVKDKAPEIFKTLCATFSKEKINSETR